jgi:hypothetical protein
MKKGLGFLLPAFGLERWKRSSACKKESCLSITVVWWIRIHGSFLQDPDSEFFTQNENKFKHLHNWLKKC